MMIVLLFVTNCQASAEKAGDFVTSEGKKNEKNPVTAPKQLDSSQMIDDTYDVYQSGKEIKNNNEPFIYFSNQSVLCYSKDSQIKTEKSDFFLYDRKTKQEHHILSINNIDTCWGDMYEKDGCLYLALGIIVHQKETSYILKIDETTFRGELIKIKGCNTIFSSVICSDHTLYVWFMKEKKDSKEYCLAYLKGKTLHPVHSWIYQKDKHRTGKQMNVLGTNGKQLFCYVENKKGSAHMEIFHGKKKAAKKIPIPFSDFQNTSDGKDGFLKIYCCKNTLFFETLNHRILMAGYDGKHITRRKSSDAFVKKQLNAMANGSYRIVTSFSNQIILCGNFENTNQLTYWEIKHNRMKNITFQVGDAEILSYQMLTGNEVLLDVFDNQTEENKQFYCKMDPKASHF